MSCYCVCIYFYLLLFRSTFCLNFLKDSMNLHVFQSNSIKSVDDSPMTNITIPKTSGLTPDICIPAKRKILQFSSSWLSCKIDLDYYKRKQHPLDGMRTVVLQTQILEYYGYYAETYHVTTKDGYILTVYRIVSSQYWDGHLRVPVYLNHGMLASSDFYFFQPAERTLPIMLLKAGFDVWIPNCRGTTYSSNHVHYHHNTDLDYWNFTFHEMGLYDMPAITDFILEITKFPKLLYIGYSLSTTMAFIGLSELPDLNDKVQAAFLIGPTAYQGHTFNPLRYGTRSLHSYEAYKAVSAQFHGKVTNAKNARDTFGLGQSDACEPSSMQCGVCDNLWFQMYGYNPGQINRTELPNLLKRFPDSASIKTISHYAQHIHSCRFQKYSYTKERNIWEYGSSEPPEYDLEEISSSLYFYVAHQDNFAGPLDVNITASKLAPGVLKGYYMVPDKLFTHLDFAIAKDADKLAYSKVIEDMKKERRLLQREMRS